MTTSDQLMVHMMVHMKGVASCWPELALSRWRSDPK
jgi:hypothetical protein